ncbi:SLOG family protein [Nonomuraea sp. NPDC049709]|uniref:SLOG family protein n=1 Tax=Nonomuraea sp. NPDC049709 TaxID=3154736 RepID=UPI00341F8B55
MTYTVLVTGSRTYDDEQEIRDALAPTIAAHGPENVTVRHGHCRKGADELIDRIATAWTGVTVQRRPADWATCKGPQCTPHHRRQRRDGTTYCPAAGVIRDAEMVDEGAEECLAFIDPCAKRGCRKARPHGSHGATATADLAEAAGIPTRRFPQETHQRHRPAPPRT